ncbi:carbohydrate-binding protein [Kutzneria buriramensis]|uniref:Carbohydrate binding protein with CBM6 domain n=1 Tax=Kutzneria buriramensis TaxID=1045776 RepID=A0A3E0GSV0_9PSEU|nr:CBM35 domain-containing protein [Kutzneria buriramensis]REH26152.1 carbohydrate binding protein with CBM6 domain [Kutzneria buriramensis]
MSLHRLFPLILVVALLPFGSAHAATSIRLEAENAALSGGAVVASDHSGYSGTGFVAGYTDGNKATAKTTFTVSTASTGSYSLTLGYANGTGSAKTLTLTVDSGSPQQITLPATANWDSWATINSVVSLGAGSHSVSYSFGTADSGNLNLDYLDVAQAMAAAGTYEAENAALSGGVVVAGDHSGYSGTGFVAGYTDGNKGIAATAFTVTTTAAGSTPVTLRYANGTGATMTLSVYTNGSKTLQTVLAATADWNTWATKTENLPLDAGTNTITYEFDTTDTGNVNLDDITVGTPLPTPSGQVYPAASAFAAGGPTMATALSGYYGPGYLTGFTTQGALADFTVNAPTTGTYPVTVAYANSTGSSQTVSLYLNGIKNGQLSAASGSGWLTLTANVSLRAGVNVVGLKTDSGDSGNLAVNYIAVAGGQPLAGRGATTPYTEYPAAAAQTNGTVLPASTTYPSLQAESTGRRAVQLTSTGQYVQFTLTKAANAIVVRYSIPDNSDGSTATAPLAVYASGNHITDLALTTKYSWLYGGGYTDTHDPSNGPAHHFYDETRALIGSQPAGTVIKLQKDSADTAASYTIDVLDAEQVDPAYTMPANFKSITDFGVTPNSGADDTSAINRALSSLSGTGTGLWFPTGTYNISGQISMANVALRGAGQWYATLQSTAVNGAGGLFATSGVNQIADLTVAGDQTDRNNNAGAAGVEGNFSAGSLIFDVWIEHTKVGIWTDAGNGLDVVNARVRDVFADGVHFNGGTTNSRVAQSVVRNAGDDELALDTENGNVTGCVLANNTVQSPIQANGIGVYGGGNNLVADNLVADTVAFGSGITVSTAFGGGFTGPTTVQDNTLTRAGSFNSNWGSALGALWIYANQLDITQPVLVAGTAIDNSTYQAVLLSYAKQISNLGLTQDTISGAGTYGIDIEDVTGSMAAEGVTVSGAQSGGLNNPNGYTINRGAGDSGF